MSKSTAITPAATQEREAWRDAYYVAYVGASNARGVMLTLAKHRNALGPDHPAVRAIAGHLAFLKGDSLGPDLDDLNRVIAECAKLGICDEAGKYLG